MPDTLETAQHFIFVTQVFFCCMYAVVIWDWIVCLPKEYRLVWKTSWTAVKMSYLFCRYWVIIVMPYVLYSFVTDHSKAYCMKTYRIPVALAMWNQAGAEVVLLIRTYAFSNRNRYLLWSLCCALAGVFAYQLYVIIHQMDLLTFVKPPFDQGPCLPMSKPHSAHVLGFFLAPLAFDTSVTFMTLWKAFAMRRRTGAASSPIIQTFLREGVFYYLLISVANLINGIFYLQPRQVISAINIPLSVMFGDILACRLILDLRERGYGAPMVTTSTSRSMRVTGPHYIGEGNVTLCDGSPNWKPPTTLSPPYRTTAYISNSAKSRSLKSVIAKAAGISNTTTADSCVRSTQAHDYDAQQSYLGDSRGGSVELQNYAPKLSDGQVKTEDVGLGITAPAYHVVDLTPQEDHDVPLRGIRIDVEKTQT